MVGRQAGSGIAGVSLLVVSCVLFMHVKGAGSRPDATWNHRLLAPCGSTVMSAAVVDTYVSSQDEIVLDNPPISDSI
jgi:hypothetical protein